MKKKFMALLTLSVFVCTLFPAAAFAAKETPADIEVHLSGDYSLTALDKNWTPMFIEPDGTAWGDYFSACIRFILTDSMGHPLSGEECLANEPAAVSGENHRDYLRVEKPAVSTLTADDLYLFYDSINGIYTIAYSGSAEEAKTDLIPGDYTLTVRLLNGATATGVFRLAYYGATEILLLDYYRVGWDGDITYVADILQNQICVEDAFYTNLRGIDDKEINVNIASGYFHIHGKAVDHVTYNNFAPVVSLSKEASKRDALIGTEVASYGYDPESKKTVKGTMTVVDQYSPYVFDFDCTQGSIGKDNTVKITLQDENGKVLDDFNGTVSARVDDQSVDGAKIALTTANMKNGVARLTLSSNIDTATDIVVTATAENGDMYGGTLHYTFGEKDANADTLIYLPLTSSDIIVNDVVKPLDSGAYATAGRTFVPFRALGEALGAEVAWNSKDNSVTYRLGENNVTLTLGKTTYIVNGETKQMDVAPSVKNNRTYVPVRFVSEALGFETNPLSNIDKLVGCVVVEG